MIACCYHHYLWVIFDEYLDFDKCAKTLSDAAGRALGSVVTKFKQYKNIGYHTFTKSYKTRVICFLEQAFGNLVIIDMRNKFKTGLYDIFLVFISCYSIRDGLA